MNHGLLRRQLAWYFLLRVIFLTLILGITATLEAKGHRLPTDKYHYPLLFIVAVYIFTIFSAALAGRIKKIHRFATIQLIFDVLLISCLVFATGTSHSLFTATYFLPIIVAGFMLFKRETLLMAASSTLAYGALLLLEHGGRYRLDLLITAPRPAVNLERLLNLLAINGISFFLTATLAALLTGRLYRAQEALSQSTSQIEAMEDRVRQSEKMAAVGEMAAGIAHEFRNPLAAISGSAQLLAQRLKDQPGQQQLLTIITRECDRLEKAVNNFLLFCRPAKPKQQWFPLQELLAESMAVIRQTPDCNTDHRLVVTESCRRQIWADRDQMRQVLLNLLANACQAMPRGGTIRCSAEPGYLDGRPALLIRISDSGPGLAPEQSRKIFDPYFTTRPNGTGLGLAIVHQIISGHGGAITVESAPGHGTAFLIQLPAGPQPR